MGLKCSVIGHKYGEADVEREREEQGSEVVITIQEQETCERCGKTRIVSENKEVTSIETPSDIAGDMIDDEDDAGEETDAASEPPAETVGESEPAPTVGEETVEPVDADEDDAEILDDSDDETADEEPSGDSELDDPSTSVSVADAEETEPATDPEEDDGVILDAEPEEQSVADDREPGQWPEEPDDGNDDWAPETAASEEETEESPDVEPVGGSAVTVPNGQFRCPECEFTTDVASSSLRAGDFCPECHKGALINPSE